MALAGPLAGCTASPAAPPSHPTPRGSAAASPGAPPLVHLPPLPARPSPTRPLAVGVRQLDLTRGPDRPLPTTIWYPARGDADGATHPGATPATGRYPLVLLSHGLMGRPEALAPIGIRWAAAGFIVAAPTYPHTNHDAAHFDILDVVNQPADASYVISQVLALDGHDGDLLAGHIDTAAVAATGHSAGGITTTGMLSAQRDPRLRAAIVMAGALLGGSYTGPVTPALFVHGDADQTVTYEGGRSAYDADPWPKAFLTVIGGDHGSYLTADGPGFEQMINATTDFLRWTLYGDVAALARLAADGTAAGTTRWESKL
nr:chlorophyllase [Planosporangium thailandense]